MHRVAAAVCNAALFWVGTAAGHVSSTCCGKRVCTVVRRICVLYSRRVWAGSSSVYVIPALLYNTHSMHTSWGMFPNQSETFPPAENLPKRPGISHPAGNIPPRAGNNPTGREYSPRAGNIPTQPGITQKRTGNIPAGPEYPPKGREYSRRPGIFPAGREYSRRPGIFPWVLEQRGPWYVPGLRR